MHPEGAFKNESVCVRARSVTSIVCFTLAIFKGLNKIFPNILCFFTLLVLKNRFDLALLSRIELSIIMIDNSNFLSDLVLHSIFGDYQIPAIDS